MINKQSLWFLTLFSLILVLSIYYITMPSELLTTTNGIVENETTNKVVSNKEADALTVMRVEYDEERASKMNDLRLILTNVDATIDEKNNAYEQLKALDNFKGKEEELEQILKDKFSMESVIKIDGDKVIVNIVAKKHNNEIANNIMRTIQDKFDSKMYITVKFQS